MDIGYDPTAQYSPLSMDQNGPYQPYENASEQVYSAGTCLPCQAKRFATGGLTTKTVMIIGAVVVAVATISVIGYIAYKKKGKKGKK